MKIPRKIEMFAACLDSIADHTDLDSVAILAALEQCQKLIEDRIHYVKERAEEEARKALEG